MLFHILPLLGCGLFSAPAGAQVRNDNIENRIPLVLNQPLNSTTVDATVQWNCLNQKLTASCIKYHNDQWFSLSVPDERPYFINLSGQDCRDIWGVQLLVFSGEPCVPSSYKALICHSDGNTDDVFIRLPPLNAGEEYLVNVDGYLNDQCAFTIEFSDTPRGLPLVAEENQGDSIVLKGLVATLHWQLDEIQSENTGYFEVYRSPGDGQPFRWVAQIPHQRNAYGEGRRNYTFTDTLMQSVAEYKVVAQTTGDRLLLLHEQVRIGSSDFRKAPENTVDLPLDFPEGTEIGVLVYATENDSLLFTDEFTFQRDTLTLRQYYIGDLRANGIRQYRVVILRKDTWAREERIFLK